MLSENPATGQEQEQGSNLPSVINDDNKMLQQVIGDVFGGIGGPELSNIDGTPNARWRMISKATGPGVKSFDDLAGKTVSVEYFYVHPVRVDGPTPGEYVDALRCVLFDSNGECYGFVSSVLARDLARMVMTFGLRPWKPPIVVQVTKSKGKHGHSFYNLVPAE